MYEQLAAVREPVALPVGEALDSGEALLMRQGYEVTRRTDISVTAVRHGSGERPDDPSRRTVTVGALPQQQGCVQITLRGDDREGVGDRQAEWSRWAESLPKLDRDQREREATAPGAAIPETTETRAEESHAPSGETGGWATVAAWDRRPRVAPGKREGGPAPVAGGPADADDAGTYDPEQRRAPPSEAAPSGSAEAQPSRSSRS